MRNFRTKEDDVAKISTSVYVTNFPDYTSAKELAQACKQYGHVVDSFIPNKKSKFGKRFGFVRFINVFSEERLINNLGTVWIDRFKIHANIARFQRNNVKQEGEKSVPAPAINSKKFGKSGVDKSFKGVLMGDKSAATEVKNNEPALVLDDECLMDMDITNALFGRVKEFASLANIKKALGNEGFSELTIKYMGELWVMLEFKSEESVNKFKECTSATSWFSQVIKASTDFEVVGRVAWIEVEGIPFKLWTGKTFSRIANKWGKLLDVDDEEDTCFHSKRICIQMKSSKSINEDFKIIHRGKCYWIRAIESPGWVPDFTDDIDEEDVNSMDEEEDDQKQEDFGENGDGEKGEDNPLEEEELVKSFGDGKYSDEKMERSVDPFNIYPILNRQKKEKNENKESDGSLEYPPGFCPTDKATVEVRSDNKEDENFARDEVRSETKVGDIDAHSECHEPKQRKDIGNESSSAGHFKKSEIPRSGGSMIGVLEEVVKVGQVMGYKMEGCISNLEEIIGSQGVEKGDR
ncbi:nucleotide-binding alpha-beta plait domain-containing protein [Tanacetum coccineum]